MNAAVQTAKVPPTKRSSHTGSIFHRPEWENVYAAYRLPYYRLTVQRDGRVAGVLPLVAMRSRLFGSQLVSLPWFDAAGISASDEEIATQLCEQALALAAELNIGVVQIRQDRPRELSPHVRTDKVVQRLKLESNPDDLWDGLKATVRNQVRKAEKSGLVVERGGAERLDQLFAVYSRNMRDLGSPSHSRRLFGAVLEAFPDETAVYIVRHEQTVVGGGLTVANGSTLEIPWASSLREYNRFCVNHGMYWRIVADACREGYEWFSFGRSTAGSGPYRYKKQWKPEESPLPWYFLSREDKHAAAAAVPPQEKFGVASRLWAKLPLGLSRQLGPFVMSRVP